MTEQSPGSAAVAAVAIRPLGEDDLEAADRVMRIAFGTFLGAPDPVAVFGDAQYVRPRYRAAPSWAFAAELDGEVVGSNFAARWGSFGFFGPLTVRPDLWDQGIASRLMEPIVDLFDQWQLSQAGLFTFPQSPRHIGLYQKFGFGPQHLTPLMEKRIAPSTDTPEHSTFSTVALMRTSGARSSAPVASSPTRSTADWTSRMRSSRPTRSSSAIPCCSATAQS